MLAVTHQVGLALARGCDSWHLRLDKFAFEREGGDQAKTDALRRVRDDYRLRAQRFLIAACQAKARLIEALRQQHGARFRSIELVAATRLLIHLGRGNVLKNVGLCAEHVSGLPWIPGTALKGVLSTWACWEANQNPDGSFRTGAEFVPLRSEVAASPSLRIFGSNSPSGSESSGDIIFLGGFPKSPPALGLDMVNPHHDALGNDLTRLTPNAFLCLEPGTVWQFACFARPGMPELEAQPLLDQTEAWLVQALTQLGIGAKVAAGYGRFRQPTDAEKSGPEVSEASPHATTTPQKGATGHQPTGHPKHTPQQRAAADALLRSDYPNAATFKARVIDRLNSGQLESLKAETDLLARDANSSRLDELKRLLAIPEYKGIRKRLREKTWFPKEWLPPQ